MDLLFLLGSEPGRVFAHAEIKSSLWPGVTVGEDTLARCVFKLRQALGDERAKPRFVETIPKRGYRFIAGGEGENSWLKRKRRAEEFYFQFTRTDNENAIAIYEQMLAQKPDDADALAGLANCLVQRTVRWLDTDGSTGRANLAEALACGALSSEAARKMLAHAELLATEAAGIAPDNAAVLRSLGLVMAVTERFAEARRIYRRALAIDPGAWGVLINLADIDGLEGREEEAIKSLEDAFLVMERRYDEEVAQIRPWYAALGLMIADRRRTAGQFGEAESWYRRVLAYAPAHEAALAGLTATQVAQSSNSATTGT